MKSLFPPSATPFEYAMEAVTSRISRTNMKPIGTLWSAQTCPLALLPYLAWALDVSPWNPQWTEAQQRAAVAASVQVHRIKGTIGSVQRALQAIGYECQIYESAPYVFRVRIDASQTPLTDESVYSDATAIALETKPARSFLAGVDGLLESIAPPVFAVASFGGVNCQVLPYILTATTAPAAACFSGGTFGVQIAVTI